MRKQIWIPLVVVLVVCLLLLLKTTKHQHVTLPVQNVVPTNQSEQPTTVENHQGPDTSKATTVPPVAITPKAVPGESSVTNSQLLADWQAPIEFYGRVIDENSNPVAGANITFKWAEIPAPDGNRTATTESDAEGLFSLHGKRGPSLAVWVGKNGYYAPHRGQWGFNYALGPDIISPDPQNPIVFVLHKKGKGESLIVMKRNYGIPRDGTPVSIDLTTGATTTSKSGNLVVQCWTQDAGKRSGEKYDWHCVVSIPGGGAVTNNEEFAFEAPENGYAPSLEIAMPADRPDWRDDVDLKFYYRLADGRYGRMTFSMVAFGHHFCMIDSVLNPSGSRNLEPP